LWEMAKTNLEKAHKQYKDFVDKSSTRSEFWKTKWSVVEYIKKLIVIRFEPQVLGPLCRSIQVLEKKFPDTYKLEPPKNLKVHPIFHVSLLKPIFRDASRPNREHNSRPYLTWFIMN
jgi:hypothetical protein